MKWPGFPYGSDQDTRGDVAKLRRLITETEDQVLVMTHVGPAGCDTQVEQEDLSAPPVTMGSEELRRIMVEDKVQDKSVLLLHGHSHRAWGQSKVGRVEVVNPGPLTMGRYAILELRRTDGRWGVESLRLQRLPHDDQDHK